MADSEIDLRGDSDALIAYLLLKIHLTNHLEDMATMDIKSLLDLYRQCLQAVQGQLPRGETGESGHRHP